MFQEVVLMSFSCPHCGNENSEIQPGGPIQDLGVRYTFLVNKKEVMIVGWGITGVLIIVGKLKKKVFRIIFHDFKFRDSNPV